MLNYFFERLVPKMPVISGWNFLDYDWRFLVNRCRRIGLKPEVSSYTNKLEKTQIAISKERIAYVGLDASHTVGSRTTLIDLGAGTDLTQKVEKAFDDKTYDKYVCYV